MAEPRKAKYTSAQRKAIKQNRHDIAVGRKYGYDTERAPAGQALDNFKKQYGAFASPTWDVRVDNGVVMYRAKGNQPDRIAATGGGWFAAPSYVQRSYSNPNRQQFFADNPQKGWADWMAAKGLQQQIARQGWVQGPGGWGPAGQAAVRNNAGWALGSDGQPVAAPSGYVAPPTHSAPPPAPTNDLLNNGTRTTNLPPDPLYQQTAETSLYSPFKPPPGVNGFVPSPVNPEDDEYNPYKSRTIGSDF